MGFFYLHCILTCAGNKSNNLPHVKMCLISYKSTFCSLFPERGTLSISAELRIHKWTETETAVKIRFTISFHKESRFLRLPTELSESIKNRDLLLPSLVSDFSDMGGGVVPS